MSRSLSSMDPVMNQRVTNTSSLSDRVARVLFLRSWREQVLGLLPWSLGVGLLLVAGVRWWLADTSLSMYWWGFPLAALLVSFAMGFVRAWGSRPSRIRAAGWFDASAQTQSRFRTALELASQDGVDAAFADLAVADAERDARAAGRSIPNPERTRALHERPRVQLGSVLLVLTVVAGIWMPAKSPPEPSVVPRSVLTTEEAQEHIQAQQDELQSVADLASEDDELVQDAFEDLAEIEQELLESDDADSGTDPDSARALADSRIQRLADELQERSEEQEQEEQALRERLDSLRSRSLPEESDLDRFREQLAEGQYEDALDELESLEERLDSMTPEEREQAARDLESLADAIDQDSPSSPSERERSTDKPASDVSEELAESMREEADRIREQEQSSAESPDVVDSNADESVDQESESDLDQRDDSVEDRASDQSNPPSDPEADPQSENQSESESTSETNRNDTAPDSDTTDESTQEQPSESAEQGNERSSEQGTKQQDGQENGQESEQPSEQERSTDQNAQEGGEQQEQQTGDERSGQQNDQTRDQEGDQQRDGQSEREGEQPQQQGDQQSGDQAGDQQQERPIDSEQDSNGEPQNREGAEDRPGRETNLREMLREAQRRSDGVQRDREMSERLREQLERSAQDERGSQQDQPADQNGNQNRDPSSEESGSENQGSQQSEGGDESTGDPQPGTGERESSDSNRGAPGGEDQTPRGNPTSAQEQSQYVPVQAADESVSADEDSSPIGRWYNPDQAGERSRSGTSDTAKRFRNASKRAREEVSDRRVPRKYRDVISEYFKKLDERAGDLSPAPAASDGQDAPSPKKSTSEGSD